MRTKNYIGFKSLEGLLWWIDDVTRADLGQCTMWWIAEGEYPYLVHATQEITQAALNEVKQKKKSRDVRHSVVKLKKPPSATHQSTLDQLWRYARPYR